MTTTPVAAPGPARAALTERRPVASLSLDADNAWSYLKIHGDRGWERFPSYLGTLVPRVLELLEAHGLRITVFVVGQDAARDENVEPLGALARAGHEIANHSFRHEPWLHRYSEGELEDELGRAEDAVAAATGAVTRGFRGPGYSLSEATLRVLVRRGYRYDASTLPTFLGPLARAWYFRTAPLDASQREERCSLYGTWADGRRPVRPYRWVLPEAVIGTDGPRRTLLEVPVTTLPGLKLPIHVSYLLTLSTVSPAAARAYLDAALVTCRLCGIGPSVLLHPLDLVSGEEFPDLAFFPGMGIPVREKLARAGSYIDALTRAFRVVPVGEHAAALEREPLPVRPFEATAVGS